MNNFQSDTSSQHVSQSAVSIESFSSSIIANTYQPPSTYLGIFYPTISTSSTRARRQMYSALICYLFSFVLVIIVYVALILFSKKLDRKI